MAKVIMALSSIPNAVLVTVNITSAYLYSPLVKDNLFVEYPTRFMVPRFDNPVCHLKKALYGLKQGARAWYQYLDKILNDLSFK